jgi:hypothetical protein
MLLCALQGLGTLFIDLGRTHAKNPDWLRHARYHVVWQAISTALLSLLQIALLLIPGGHQDELFYLSAALASIPMLGFFGAFATRKLFASALFDPNGIPPLRIVVSGAEKSIDLNLVAEVIAITVLFAIVALFRT